MASPTVSLDSTFGALEIGTLIAVFLFGVVTLQTDFYFREFQNDKQWLKGTVFLVW